MREQVHQAAMVQARVRGDEDGDEQQDDEPTEHRDGGREHREERLSRAGELLAQPLPKIDLPPALLSTLFLTGALLPSRVGLLAARRGVRLAHVLAGRDDLGDASRALLHPALETVDRFGDLLAQLPHL